MKFYCKHCGRYIMDIKGTTIIENLVCPNSKCKAHLNVKAITPSSTTDEINYHFTQKEVPPKNES